MRISDWSSDVCSSDLAAFNNWGQKRRRPFEAVAAALRLSGSDWTPNVGDDKSGEFSWRMGFTGHTPYDWPAPNGYPDTAVAWSGSNSFGMTWKLLNWLSETKDADVPLLPILEATRRSEEHTSALQSLMRNSYAVFCLKKKKTTNTSSDHQNIILHHHISHEDQ